MVFLSARGRLSWQSLIWSFLYEGGSERSRNSNRTACSPAPWLALWRRWLRTRLYGGVEEGREEAGREGLG